MIVDTETGEVLDSPPRQSWDSSRDKREQRLRDINLGLAIYSVLATMAVIVLGVLV